MILLITVNLRHPRHLRAIPKLGPAHELIDGRRQLGQVAHHEHLVAQRRVLQHVCLLYTSRCV